MQPARKSRSERPCDRCGSLQPRLYRVRTDAHDWRLVCLGCYDHVSTQPGYTYGGTWTNRKRP